MWYLFLSFRELAAMLDWNFPPQWVATVWQFYTPFQSSTRFRTVAPLSVSPVTFGNEVNMANTAVSNYCKNSDSCFRAEIILKRKNDGSILLWRCDSESQWELPWFFLKESESFQQGIERWCSNQLQVSLMIVFFRRLRCQWNVFLMRSPEP